MERWEDFPTKNNKNVNYLFSLFKIIESSLDRCIFLGTNMMSLGDSRYYTVKKKKKVYIISQFDLKFSYIITSMDDLAEFPNLRSYSTTNDLRYLKKV